MYISQQYLFIYVYVYVCVCVYHTSLHAHTSLRHDAVYSHALIVAATVAAIPISIDIYVYVYVSVCIYNNTVYVCACVYNT